MGRALATGISLDTDSRRQSDRMDQQQTKTRGVADIVFLIDVSGSMAPAIDALKANIGTFVESLSKGEGNNISPVRDWRAKAVGYRDFEHDPQAFIDNPFVSDVEALRGQLAGLHGRGRRGRAGVAAGRAVQGGQHGADGERRAEHRPRQAGATAATRRAWWWCSPTPRSSPR